MEREDGRGRGSKEGCSLRRVAGHEEER